MSKNEYMEQIETNIEIRGGLLTLPDHLLASIALVKELQTLNVSVKLLILEVKGINLGLPID